MRPGQFTSHHQAQNTRKHSWACLRCNYVTTTKPAKKAVCDCGNLLHYFPSKAELKRFHSLRLEQQCGLISDLELQPSYLFVANGKHFSTYRADFRYTRNGVQVVEDVKGTTDKRYLEKEFLLKRKMVDSFFGIEIKIVKG